MTEYPSLDKNTMFPKTAGEANELVTWKIKSTVVGTPIVVVLEYDCETSVFSYLNIKLPVGGVEEGVGVGVELLVIVGVTVAVGVGV